MKRLDRRERNRLKGERFEELVELLFRSMGYATKRKTGDNFIQTKDFDRVQIDIIAEKPGDRVLVECKNYSLYPISQKDIHYFYSALEAAGSGWRGVYVTWNAYEEPVKRYAHGKPIELWDRSTLMEHAQRSPDFFKGLLSLSADGLAERYRNDPAFIDTVLTLAAGRDPRFEALSQTEEELPAPENFSKEGWRKAVEFEAYCRGLFSRKYFEIVMYAKDLRGEASGSADRLYYPDYVIEYKPTNERFSVECKYRSNMPEDDSPIEWTSQRRLEQYLEFSEKEDLPLFVVIGVGGTPSSPERMFCLPLDEADSPAIDACIYLNRERDPAKMFYWKDGSLE